MKNRTESGATLALVAACGILGCLIGIAIFYLLETLAGSSELKGSTESGSLGVAKQALTGPTITLNSGVEANNFSGLAGQNNQVDLLAYNRLVGQTLLVALNASAEGTQTAQDNATSLIQTLHSSPNNISQRLSDSLKTWTNSNACFSALAMANATSISGQTPRQQPLSTDSIVAYTCQGSPTNIYLDPTILPSGTSLPANALSTVTSKSSGQQYINGYTDLTIGSTNSALGQLPAIAGMTVNPQQQPHLIAKSTFQSALTNPVKAGAVPPNSFQLAIAATTTATRIPGAASCSTIGALNQDYPACIPHGYIVVTNPSGDSDSSPLPSKESIFNNQLFTGIFVANNGAFSTDESLIQMWADYNNGQSGQTPPTTGLFNASGGPVTGEQNGITALGGNGYPALADYTNVQGPNANPAAEAMLPAFEAAYPAPLASNGSGCVLTAVEKLKAEVMELYATGQGGKPASVPQTGLRVFQHNQTYVVGSGQSPEFTRPGTIAELCNQADPNNTGAPQNTVSPQNATLTSLKQRLKEIKPTATDAEMNELLTGNTIDLGQTFYIWLEYNTFRMTQTAPPWVAGSQTADGAPQEDSTAYPTIGFTVDPVGEAGFNQTLFADQPNPQTSDLGIDLATWTPSSGYNNLLGQLTFGEIIADTASVAAVTMPDPTPSPAPTPVNPVVPVTPVVPVNTCTQSPWVTAVKKAVAGTVGVDGQGKAILAKLNSGPAQGHITGAYLANTGGYYLLMVFTWDDQTVVCNGNAQFLWAN